MRSCVSHQLQMPRSVSGLIIRVLHKQVRTITSKVLAEEHLLVVNDWHESAE